MGEPEDDLSDEFLSDDRLLDGRVRLLQPRRGHRVGTDAVVLASLAPAAAGDRVVDLGAGTGAVGLLVASRVPDLRLVLVEREPHLVSLCRRNLALNGREEHGLAIEADAFGSAPEWSAAGLRPGEADLVATNPPFFEAAGSGALSSPEPERRSAHVMRGGGLSGWLAAAARLLRPGGRLALIHRADALALCLAALPRSLGSPELHPVHARPGSDAVRVVILARKDGRAPLRMRPAFRLDDGRPAAETKRVPEGALDDL